MDRAYLQLGPEKRNTEGTDEIDSLLIYGRAGLFMMCVFYSELFASE